MDKDSAAIQKKLQSELDIFKASQKGKFRLKINFVRLRNLIKNVWEHIFCWLSATFLLFLFFITDFTKFVQQRQVLDGQLTENKHVMDELNILGPDSKVIFFVVYLCSRKISYSKSFGPVLGADPISRG